MVTEQGERGPKETRIRTDILGRGLHYGVERVYLEEFISDNHDNVDDDNVMMMVMTMLMADLTSYD